MIGAFAAFTVLLLLLAIASGTLSRKCSAFAYAVLAASVIVSLLAQLIWVRPHLLTYALPIPDVLAFANLYPLAAAIALPAAVAIGKGRAQKIRIAVLMVILLGVSLTGTVRLFGTPVEVGETQFWPDGTCRQTSIDSCSAAAAVTLLKENSIEATEGQIARWAMTSQGRGTHPLGIYRGLKMAATASTATVDVKYRAVPARDLLERNSPAIVNVGLIHSPETDLENRLVTEAQWQPGVVHSVVFLGRDGDKVKIADPDFGVERWPMESFQVLYRGTALWLERVSE